MKPAARQALILTAVGAVAFLAFFLLDLLSDRAPGPALTRNQLTLLVALSLLTVYAILALHELGHLAASWIVGLRFQSLTVGPFTLSRTHAELRLRWNPNLRLFRGVLRFEAAADEPPTRRLAFVLAAGPLASILAGLAAALLALSGRAPPLDAASAASSLMAHRLLALLASGSMAVGLANLIPLRFAGGSSDGARLWQLYRESRSASRARAAN